MNEGADSIPTQANDDGHRNAIPVKVRFHETESGLKCIFRGRMDAANVSEIEDEMKKRLAGALRKKIAYELSAVDYIASSFLRLCIMAAKTSAGDFAILSPSHEVRKVLRTAGLEHLVKNV